MIAQSGGSLWIRSACGRSTQSQSSSLRTIWTPRLPRQPVGRTLEECCWTSQARNFQLFADENQLATTANVRTNRGVRLRGGHAFERTRGERV